MPRQIAATRQREVRDVGHAVQEPFGGAKAGAAAAPVTESEIMFSCQGGYKRRRENIYMAYFIYDVVGSLEAAMEGMCAGNQQGTDKRTGQEMMTEPQQ